jgi:hypothetical protein
VTFRPLAVARRSIFAGHSVVSQGSRTRTCTKTCTKKAPCLRLDDNPIDVKG